MTKDIIQYTEKNMKKCLFVFKENINKIRTERISTNILNGIKIKYYDTLTSIKQLANITLKDFSTLKIDLFDSSLLKLIEKEIISSNIGIYPTIIGNSILAKAPPLSEERRKSLIKIIKKESEKVKIIIRNIRRDANDKIKSLVKNKTISSDYERTIQKRIQELTDNYIEKIKKISLKKEMDLIKLN